MIAYNTINKIGNRTLDDLEDISILMLEDSYRNYTSDLYIDVNKPLTTNHNLIDKSSSKGRKVSDLEGLLINILEKSYRVININVSFKTMKPFKSYNGIKLRLYKKYILNLKG